MGATIGQYILDNALTAQRDRLAALQRICAPEIVVEQAERKLAAMLAGEVPAQEGKGEQGLLDREFSAVAWAKGRGGKPWATFTTAQGPVRFYPAGRFGPFVTASE